MAENYDVVILGSGYRGLWLSTELVKLGWTVAWFQVQSHSAVKVSGDFDYDDWPWQVGPHAGKTHFMTATKEFIDEVLKPIDQDIAVQIITPLGPIEFSGPAQQKTLEKFFPTTHQELVKYFQSIETSHKGGRGQKILTVHTQKLFKNPLGQRWILEWLGALRRPRAVTTQEWILNWDGDLLDPSSRFWLLNDNLEKVTERALLWAEKKGVKVKRNAQVSDIGIEGRRVTGVEIQGGQGFIGCKNIILGCSYEMALKAVPRFAKNIERQLRSDSEVFVWARCGFFLKPDTKPQGLCEFSSFVIDPYMPYVGANMGLLKWKTGERGDSLTVWARIPFSELKRRSYLMNLTEEIEKNLGSLFPWFIKRLVAVFPFEEYFHSPDASHDGLAIVFDGKNKFKHSYSKLKNVTLMGPGSDRGLELLSQLATEFRHLAILAEVRKKELKRDRTLHPPRNGQNLGTGI